MAPISTYWGPVRPLRHHFRTGSHKRDRIKSITYMKSVDALAHSIDRKICGVRFAALKRVYTHSDTIARAFYTAAVWKESHVVARTHSWKPLVTDVMRRDWFNRLLLATWWHVGNLYSVCAYT